MKQLGIFRNLVLLLATLWLGACGNSATSDNSSGSQAPPDVNPGKVAVVIPEFIGQNAYKFIEKQLSFGHRVPGSAEHEKCKNWLVSQLKKSGAIVDIQEFKASFMSKENQNSYNIIAKINPDNSRRILLAAHWDSRIIAEKDTNKTNQNKPILGADDGGSGVGVLLEIAQTIQSHPIDLGIDIVFFDAEDQGSNGGKPESWCLGSQHWSKNVQLQYRYLDAILLDMVGGSGATFYYDAYSVQYARPTVEKLWTLANQMGYGNYFRDKGIGGLVDDHYFVNTIANIPMIDIINYQMKSQTDGEFPVHHHTQADNLKAIDINTLSAVGQVVTAYVYKRSDGSL